MGDIWFASPPFSPKAALCGTAGAAAYPLKRLPDARFAEVCALLNQIIQLPAV